MVKKVDVRKSPVFYMGNKERLIKKGLIDMFPKDIKTFIEPFSGSGVVSINVEASKYILNDIDTNVINLLKLFREHTAEHIVNHINTRIKEFDLNEPPECNIDDVRDAYKLNYNTFRSFHNNQNPRQVLDLYTLTFYSHSNIMRFNGKGDFNAPRANDLRKFKDGHEQKVQHGCEFFRNNDITFLNGDYKTSLQNIEGDNVFIYCDPPYLNTTAVYNEKKGDDC